jgi:pyridoxine 5-phosphate synthase
MRLHINVDHVATLRNARGTPYPDPVDAARVCLEAGAHGITAHLREDRRHIIDADVDRLRATLRDTFNLEMASTDEMVKIACRVLPDVVTLVPERREERTTEGGLEVANAGPHLRAHVEALRGADIKVSLFIAPDLRQVDAAHALGVEQIELHTGEYAHAFAEGEPASVRDLTRRPGTTVPPTCPSAQFELEKIDAAAKHAKALGLEVAAGHGLTTRNVVALVAIKEIAELNIGHAVIADAVFLSLAGAVRAMTAAVERGERHSVRIRASEQA